MADSLATRLDDLQASIRRWWRPLGRNSALQPRNQHLLDDQQRAAREREGRKPGERWWSEGGRLVVAHAGLKQAYHGRPSARVLSFALYGETTGETDESAPGGPLMAADRALRSALRACPSRRPVVPN